MPDELKGLYKLGGAAFIISGILFLSRDILELIAGPPPSSGLQILAWVQSEKLVLSFVNEILFFAALTLVPAVIALYHSLAGRARATTATGCGIMAAAIPVVAILLIVHGRLVYPVYGIRVDSPAVAEYVVAVFYGGMHAFYLMLAAATFVLSVAMMHGGYGRPVAYLGFATSVLDVAGSYPDLIGVGPTFVCRVLFAGWFAAVGSRLYSLR